MEIPPRTLAFGVPAKVKRDLRVEEIARLEQSWRSYVEYKDEYLRK
jgi:carbonic anhydrase/acetyltransferase-like protein (isoleucine patch superfamily)